MAKITNLEQIKPIAQNLIKTMYGDKVRDLRFRIVEKFTMKPNYWDVAVDFKDDRNEYTVDLEVDETDGKVTSAREIIRWEMK